MEGEQEIGNLTIILTRLLLSSEFPISIGHVRILSLSSLAVGIMVLVGIGTRTYPRLSLSSDQTQLEPIPLRALQEEGTTVSEPFQGGSTAAASRAASAASFPSFVCAIDRGPGTAAYIDSSNAATNALGRGSNR